MNYTTTTPKKPGIFAFRSDDKSPDIFVRVTDDNLPFYQSMSGGEWSGPLVLVEEVEKAYKEGWNDGYDTGPNCPLYPSSRARRVVEGYEP